ncbi:MAG: hypothetical protein NTV48_01115 [Candidatus Vogelbacteria bacterium]|nr:hypothetical protein [Candidatus Vogelbacteria bacterium]
MQNRGVIIFTLIAIAVILIIARIFQWPEPAKIPTNFSSCVEAGFPIMESYPRQCIDKNQRVFVEEKMTEATSTPLKIEVLIPKNSTASPQTSTSSKINPKTPTSSSTNPKTPRSSGASPKAPSDSGTGLKNSSST